MKKLCLLGSTGSIGTQTLDIVRMYPQDFSVRSLAAYSSIDLLEKQIREFRPARVCVYSEERAAELKIRVSDTETKVLSGMEGLIECATDAETDIVLGAIVGMIGIRPTIEAIRAGKDIAIANKETLVTAGHLIMPLVEEKRVRLLPVDSEHSAIFQCLHGEENNPLSRILLTASGGPFRGRKREELVSVRPEDALKHPNWAMGAKITIDSSTLVNKGLEVMEARWLFNASYDEIEVVLQPQSVIHSMVEFRDGAIKAQLGTPDMHIPIAYALFYPDRRPCKGGNLDFKTLSGITFEQPDTEVFEALPLAYQVGRKGGNAPTVFNAANELSVAKFLRGELPYLGIVENIKKALDEVEFIAHPTLDEVLYTEKRTQEVLR